MKKQLILKISAAAVLLAFWLFNVGTLKSAPPADHFRGAQSQARKAWPGTGHTPDQNLEDEKQQRYQMLEWLIVQGLMRQYQKLEIDLDLEDKLE
jgi:hypothetical protein